MTRPKKSQLQYNYGSSNVDSKTLGGSDIWLCYRISESEAKGVVYSLPLQSVLQEEEEEEEEED